MDIFKADLVNEYAQKENITKVEAEKRINDVLELITVHLVNGRNVKIINFFNFIVKELGSKQAVNPQTGEPMVIGATRTCVVKMSKRFKKRIQGKI